MFITLGSILPWGFLVWVDNGGDTRPSQQLMQIIKTIRHEPRLAYLRSASLAHQATKIVKSSKIKCPTTSKNIKWQTTASSTNDKIVTDVVTLGWVRADNWSLRNGKKPPSRNKCNTINLNTKIEITMLYLQIGTFGLWVHCGIRDPHRMCVNNTLWGRLWGSPRLGL